MAYNNTDCLSPFFVDHETGHSVAGSSAQAAVKVLARLLVIRGSTRERPASRLPQIVEEFVSLWL